MVARLRLTRTGPLLVAVVLLLLAVAWRAGMLDARSWMQGGYGGITPRYTEDTLFAGFPLVVEGTLVPQGEGVVKWRDWRIPYDRHQLNVTQVWSGSKELKSVMLVFPKSAEGVGVSDHVQVDLNQTYVFFLRPEPPSAGAWAGLRSVADDQRIWRVEGDRIVPTVSHLREKTRSEFAAFIAAQAQRQQQPAALAEG